MYAMNVSTRVELLLEKYFVTVNPEIVAGLAYVLFGVAEGDKGETGCRELEKIL